MKRIRITLISLVPVLLVLVIGAMPASARSAAGGGAGTAALTVEPAQPGPPTELAAAAVSSSEVDLSWHAPAVLTSTDSGSPAASYNIYQGTQAGQEGSSPINSSPVPATSYNVSYKVTGLAAGTQYFFVVTAVDSAGNEGGPSDEASATTANGGPLGPPTGLAAKAVSSSEVDLSWTAPASGGGSPAAGYNIYQGTQAGGEDSSPVNSSPVTDTSYKVTGLDSGTQYFFVVTAVDSAGTETNPSGEASATTANGGPLGPPTGPPGTSVSPGLIIVPIILIAAIVGALVVWRRRRTRSASVPQQPVPGPTVRAEPHAGPPGVVSVRTTGTGPTHSVRIVPYPGPSITTIKEPLP